MCYNPTGLGVHGVCNVMLKYIQGDVIVIKVKIIAQTKSSNSVNECLLANVITGGYTKVNTDRV